MASVSVVFYFLALLCGCRRAFAFNRLSCISDLSWRRNNKLKLSAKRQDKRSVLWKVSEGSILNVKRGVKRNARCSRDYVQPGQGFYKKRKYIQASVVGQVHIFLKKDGFGMYLVSACLLGVCCKYDGKHNYHPGAEARGQNLCPVCPEQMGGLPTPRMVAEISGGDGFDVLDGRAGVVSKDGGEITGFFLRGAAQVLYLAGFFKVKKAIFKEGSPSCGVRYIKDGSFKNTLRPGPGVTTALLLRNGIVVLSEKGLPGEERSSHFHQCIM